MKIYDILDMKTLKWLYILTIYLKNSQQGFCHVFRINIRQELSLRKDNDAKEGTYRAVTYQQDLFLIFYVPTSSLKPWTFIISNRGTFLFYVI